MSYAFPPWNERVHRRTPTAEDWAEHRAFVDGIVESLRPQPEYWTPTEGTKPRRFTVHGVFGNLTFPALSADHARRQFHAMYPGLGGAVFSVEAAK